MSMSEQSAVVTETRTRGCETLARGRTKYWRRCGMRRGVVGHMVMRRGSRWGCMISRATVPPSRMATVGTTGLKQSVVPRVHCWVEQTTPVDEELSTITHRVSSSTTVEAPTRTLCKKVLAFFGVRNFPQNRHMDFTRSIMNSTNKMSCIFRSGPRSK